MVGEVTALQHEARNHTVEGASLEAEAFLVRAQSAEVLSGFRDDIGAKLCVGEDGSAISLIVVLLSLDEVW